MIANKHQYSEANFVQRVRNQLLPIKTFFPTKMDGSENVCAADVFKKKHHPSPCIIFLISFDEISVCSNFYIRRNGPLCGVLISLRRWNHYPTHPSFPHASHCCIQTCYDLQHILLSPPHLQNQKKPPTNNLQIFFSVSTDITRLHI